MSIVARVVGAVISASQKAWLAAAIANANLGNEHDIGVLDAGNDLAFTNQPRGFFMQRDTVEIGETVTIPADHQMIVADNLTIDGAVIADGDLHII